MLLYCLKCKKTTETKNPRDRKAEEKCFYQNVWCLIVKNKDWLKSKMLEGY